MFVLSTSKHDRRKFVVARNRRRSHTEAQSRLPWEKYNTIWNQSRGPCEMRLLLRWKFGNGWFFGWTEVAVVWRKWRVTARDTWLIKPNLFSKHLWKHAGELLLIWCRLCTTSWNASQVSWEKVVLIKNSMQWASNASWLVYYNDVLVGFMAVSGTDLRCCENS